LKDQAGNAKIELERLTNYYNGKFVPRFSYTAVYHTSILLLNSKHEYVS